MTSNIRASKVLVNEVVCAGSSRGTPFALAYAAWAFRVAPNVADVWEAHARLNGLVLTWEKS
eukprot:2870470-Rhodomonas_salina.1